MKYLNLYILLITTFYSTNIFGQSEYLLKFETLEVVDTVRSKQIIAEYRSKSELQTTDFFLVEDHSKNDFYGEIFLYLKQPKFYLVYQLPFENHSRFSLSDNRKFITTQISYHHGARNLISDSKEFCIINAIENSYLCIASEDKFESWQYIEKEINGKTELVQSEVDRKSCQSKFILEDNQLTVLKTCLDNNSFVDDCESCFGSGVYQISNNSLKKIKDYSEESKAVKPIRWADKIHSGMTIENLVKSYPNAEINQEPQYKYGFGSNELGYEIRINQEVHFFVAAPKEIVGGISVVSSKYSFNGVNTETTISQVLEKYPDSKLHIDLIDDWEYMYLKNEKITLIFKTNSTNRIGIYDFDPEDAANGIKRNDAKINLILIQ